MTGALYQTLSRGTSFVEFRSLTYCWVVKFAPPSVDAVIKMFEEVGLAAGRPRFVVSVFQATNTPLGTWPKPSAVLFTVVASVSVCTAPVSGSVKDGTLVSMAMVGL